MGIKGPNIQVPQPGTPMLDGTGELHPTWQAYHNSIQQTVFAGSRNGPTTSRPTSSMSGRYLGMPYFDTTLGLTVFLKNTTTWVKGDGTPA